MGPLRCVITEMVMHEPMRVGASLHYRAAMSIASRVHCLYAVADASTQREA